MLAEHTVDPVADRARRPARLDVDVARSRTDAVADDEVGQLHHRGGAGILFGDRLRAHLLDEPEHVLALGFERAEKGLHRLLRRVALVHGLLDGRRRSHLEEGGTTRRETQGALRLDVRRIAGRHYEVTVVFHQGVDMVLARHRLRNQEDGVGVGRLEIRHLEPEVIGHELRQPVIRDSVGSRDRGPRLRGPRARGQPWQIVRTAAGQVGALRDAHQPMHRRRRAFPLAAVGGGVGHRNPRTTLRLRRFSSYMALSASVSRSSSRVRSSASCRARPILTDSW